VISSIFWGTGVFNHPQFELADTLHRAGTWSCLTYNYVRSLTNCVYLFLRLSLYISVLIVQLRYVLVAFSMRYTIV